MVTYYGDGVHDVLWLHKEIIKILSVVKDPWSFACDHFETNHSVINGQDDFWVTIVLS